MHSRLKRMAVMALAAVTTVALATGGTYGVSKKQMMEAYSDIQIEYNGTTLTDTDGPLLINNKTYIPLRMLMNYFGDKDVTWDNALRMVRVKSKQSAMESMYMAQITARNAQIAELEKQVKDLKAQLLLAQTTSKELNLTKLKKALNSDYGDFEDKDITINVTGDADNITLTLTMTKADWTALSSTKKSSLLKQICNDIWDEADSATIKGNIKTSSTTLASFTVKAGKTITLSDAAPDLDDLAVDVARICKSDWTGAGMVLSLTITGTESRITYKNSLDFTSYGSKWDALSSTSKKRLMDNLYDEIADAYPDATITGYLYDSKGKENIAKYDGSKLTEY